MGPHELKEILKSKSFDEVRIHVSDGMTYDIRHPDMVLVTANLVHIATPPMDDDVPAGRTAYVDPLHITRVEPLNGHARKNARPGRKPS